MFMTIRPKTFDMRALRLTAEEGFVLSRVDGPLSLSDLIALSGLQEARIVEILERLAQQGAIEVEPPFGVLEEVAPDFARSHGVVKAASPAAATGEASDELIPVQLDEEPVELIPLEAGDESEPLEEAGPESTPTVEMAPPAAGATVDVDDVPEDERPTTHPPRNAGSPAVPRIPQPKTVEFSRPALEFLQAISAIEPPEGSDVSGTEAAAAARATDDGPAPATTPLVDDFALFDDDEAPATTPTSSEDFVALELPKPPTVKPPPVPAEPDRGAQVVQAVTNGVSSVAPQPSRTPSGEITSSAPTPRLASEPPPTSLEPETLEPATIELARPVHGVCGETNTGMVRTNNEDAFAVIDLSRGELVDVTELATVPEGPRGLLFVVSDGMGGANAGEVASALVLEALRESLAGGSATEDPIEVLRVAIEHANKRVISAARERTRQGMGATLVAVLIKGGFAFTAEVGDSRVYLHRGSTCQLISKDQTYVQVLLDQGLLTPETVKSSRAKNVVLQAIGKAPRLAVAQRRLALRKGDRLLLCSDGLTAHFEGEEIGDILGGSPLEEAVRDLVVKTNERGGKDNITVLVVGIGNSAPPAPPDETIADTLVAVREFAVSDGED